jgi:DNA modification methylase
MKNGAPEINKIHHGDCLDMMRRLPAGSVDLIFADPPYNLQLHRDLYRPDRSRVKAVDDGWDKFESFCSYDDFTRAWLFECHRVLKDTGSIWAIGTYHNIFRVGALLQDAGFWILNDIIWVKTNPMPNFMGTRFANAHETLIWASKSKDAKYTFHYRSMKVFNDGLQMRSDWLIPVCKGPERIKEGGRKAHPTQKPEELLYRIIIATTNPGDLVVDPFAGTGTTAAVARRLGRNFIGFEQELDYVNLARERLDAVKPLQHDLLEIRNEKRLPRVPFGALVASGMIIAGECLWSSDRKFMAEVQADASLVCSGMTGSIHSLGTQVSGRERTNGWNFWYVEREGKLLSVDKLRDDYRKRLPRSFQSAGL